MKKFMNGKDIKQQQSRQKEKIHCKTRADVNFLVLPYFSLDKSADIHREIEFKKTQRRENQRLEIVWTVIPHPKYGLPRDFKRRLQRTVEHSISNLPRPISNPVLLPRYSDLARMMVITCSGRFVQKVKNGFMAMMTTVIQSKRSYYNRQKNLDRRRFSPL